MTIPRCSLEEESNMADTLSRGGPLPRSGGSVDGLTEEQLEQAKLLEEIEHRGEFRAMERAKIKFIVPATIFFMVYYFALPVLVGFFGTNSDGTQGFMDTRLAPGLSVAYLFALSQFIMAWILAFIYLLAFAPKIDRMVHTIVDSVLRHNAKRADEKGGR
jgi:uncharacterized membrane protein (DUF485 family)